MLLTPPHQSREYGQKFRIIRGPQPCHRIPARHRREPSRPASLVPSARDIVERTRVGIYGWVDEADSRFAAVDTLFVDEGDDRAEGGRRGRGAVDDCWQLASTP